MILKSDRIAGGVLSAFVLLSSALPASIYADAGTAVEAIDGAAFCERKLGGAIFARTELFFGLSKPDGGVVSEEEFQFFVDNEVTPRFPDGLTLLTGAGQFRDSTGIIIQEDSKLLILLYTFNNKSNRAVERIRDEYKEAFQQQSVLRADEPTCVSF